MSNHRLGDAVIVGGGVAGAAAACHLAAAGRSVILLEKEAAPRQKVCGEFISAEAQSLLAEVGVDIRALGAAPIRTLHLIHGTRSARVGLPFPAAGLSRFLLDEHLLQRARQCGADIRRGVAVRAIERQGPDGWRVTTARGEAIRAEAVFLACGKHDMRQLRRSAGESESDWIGLKMHFRLRGCQTDALAGTVDVSLFAGGYAGLQLVENATANLCLAIRKSAFARLGRSWPVLLEHLMATSPHLGARLEGAVPCWDAPLAIAAVPFGYLCDELQSEDELYRLGDQISVIPAFSGNGISIALHTARLAADSLLRGIGASAYHRRVLRDVGKPVRLATRLSRMTAHRWTRDLAVHTGRVLPALITQMAARTRIARAPA